MNHTDSNTGSTTGYILAIGKKVEPFEVVEAFTKPGLQTK